VTSAQRIARVRAQLTALSALSPGEQAALLAKMETAGQHRRRAEARGAARSAQHAADVLEARRALKAEARGLSPTAGGDGVGR